MNQEGGAQKLIKVIPNCLSIIRIILSFSLIFTVPLSFTFYVIYLICGISDIMDGIIARKTGSCSELGARLDSAADLIMVIALFFRIFPMLKLPDLIVLWVIIIFIIRLISVTIVLVKYKTFAILHTWSNKAAGFALFLAPFLLYSYLSGFLMYMICGIASLSAIEEMTIHLTSRQLQVDKKSIFSE